MKPSGGEITFEHYTKDDKFLLVTAFIRFDKFGEPSLDVAELEDDAGKEVAWHSIPMAEREVIETYALEQTVPQDELFDEFEELE